MDRVQDLSAKGDATVTASADAAIDAPAVIGTDERRMHVRAYNYWVSLLNGRNYPAVDDIDLDNLSDFGPHSVLLDFTEPGAVPAIVWLGEKLRAECDLPNTVASVSEVPPRSLLSRLTDHHLQIIANRAPIGFEAEFVSARGNNAMYRGILLPFSSDDDTIDFIYGVINWKEIASEAETSAIVAQLEALKPVPARQMIPAWADGPSAGKRPVLTIAEEARPAERISQPATAAIAVDNADIGDLAVDAVARDDSSLADWLAAARAGADAALTADSRGRAALYKALAGAYDFALVAERRADEYRTLLSESRVSIQARAPMTPVVKLIFGSGYDKTRVTEFAAALSFARRRGLPAGGMKLFLENFPGGLKGIVSAERRERRPDGKPAKPDTARENARTLPEQAYLTLSGQDEFVVLVARRVDAERVAVIGVVPDDRALLDRALRQITD